MNQSYPDDDDDDDDVVLPVPPPDIVPLPPYDAGEGGPQQPPWYWLLRHPGRPQLQVLGGGVDLGVGLHRDVGEEASQLVPASEGFEATELSVPEYITDISLSDSI